MCSSWRRASAQRPFVVARVASWGLPLIVGQLFISKGRGRAKKREKNINREEGGGGGKKSQPLLPIIGKNIKVFSACVKRKKRREGEEERVV